MRRSNTSAPLFPDVPAPSSPGTKISRQKKNPFLVMGTVLFDPLPKGIVLGARIGYIHQKVLARKYAFSDFQPTPQMNVG